MVEEALIYDPVVGQEERCHAALSGPVGLPGLGVHPHDGVDLYGGFQGGPKVSAGLHIGEHGQVV